jgi:hypothetical protein
LGESLSIKEIWEMNMNEVSISLEDLLGNWSLTYKDERGGNGTLTIDRKDDGDLRITVSTDLGGESEAENIVIAGDCLLFSRKISVQGQESRVIYTTRLTESGLEGACAFESSGTHFTATKSE